MNGRRPSEPRSAIPLVVAIIGLLATVASFGINDENVGATIFGSGLITAIFCVFYWIISPKID